VVARSKAGVCGCLLLGLRFRIPRQHGRLSVVSAMCCPIEVSVSGRSLFQRSPTECDISERDREPLQSEGPGRPRAVALRKKKKFQTVHITMFLVMLIFS